MHNEAEKNQTPKRLVQINNRLLAGKQRRQLRTARSPKLL